MMDGNSNTMFQNVKLEKNENDSKKSIFVKKSEENHISSRKKLLEDTLLSKRNLLIENDEVFLTNHLQINIDDKVREYFCVLNLSEKIEFCIRNINEYQISNNPNLRINQYIILYFLRITINDNLGSITIHKEIISKLCNIILKETYLPSCYEATLIIKTLLDDDDSSVADLYNFDILVEFFYKPNLYNDVQILINILIIIEKIYSKIVSQEDFTELKSNEFCEIMLFIQNIFRNMSIIHISVVKKVIWFLNIVLDDYKMIYRDIYQEIVLTISKIILYIDDYRVSLEVLELLSKMAIHKDIFLCLIQNFNLIFYLNNSMQSFIETNNVSFKHLKYLLTIIKDILSYDNKTVLTIFNDQERLLKYIESFFRKVMNTEAKREVFPILLDVIYNIIAINSEVAYYFTNHELIKLLFGINSYIKDNNIIKSIYEIFYLLLSYRNEPIEINLINLKVHFLFYDGLLTQNKEIITFCLGGLIELMRFSGNFLKKEISNDIIKRILNFQYSTSEQIAYQAKLLLEYLEIDLMSYKDKMDIC